MIQSSLLCRLLSQIILFTPRSSPVLQPIVTFVTIADTISLTLTSSQFSELNRALISYNKRRVFNRNHAAKCRGSSSSKPYKPSLFFTDVVHIPLPYHPSLPVLALPHR